MKFLRPILDSDNVEFRSREIEKSISMLERHFPFKMHDYQKFRFAIFYVFQYLMKILICGVVVLVKMVLHQWILFFL